MVIDVVMPQLGESVTEGQIVRWLKQPNQPVARFEPLVEVLTDKVTVEVPSPVEGRLLSIEVPEGETVPVGTVIARLEAAGATAPATPEPRPAGTVQSTGPGPAGLDAEGATGGGGAEARYSPAVRRLAREHGVDLARVRGTGHGGRVTREDVLAYVAARQRQATAPPSAPPEPPSTPQRPPAVSPGRTPEPAGAVPASPVRQVIARRMVESWTTIPHAWTMVEADVTALAALREQVRETFVRREGFELTYLPFAVKAVVETLQEHPELNASWQDGRIVYHRSVHVGVAVGLEDALLVPVIREAERLSLVGLARALHDLVRRARERRLGADETAGGTFTVNNTGALGSVLSAPIINPPQAAILTTEAVQRRLVVLKDDQLAIRSIMALCLSFDHRVADGVQALRFLNGVKRRLEAFGPGMPLA
ncbi:dihydrolipoamide acetyltransferase family protein [Geochorda subterranea]|uniref:Dihydrolipoamide acetyltransferase component of pyruvate dehydrogenase complex n=1 Tax=Geochorda subterranea TaxID=3109564 RepID=A0ABZ1BPB7_9FIRM|nr:dihydrolipoamide acetyltransferase family protein [Limnochorda sp. LNt]WRP14679.1 dihydrolipoamide acetyltransferase family protein [Limnochorda sp. LNt]